MTISHSSQNIKIYKFLLISFYIWLLLEGIFRKWLLNAFSTPLFFIKYVMIIGLSLIYILNKEKISTKIFTYWPLLCFYILFGLFEILITTANFSFFVGLIGFIVHFSNIMIPFLMVKLITDRTKLLNVIKWVLWISIPLCILGIIQYNLPFDNVLNRYVTEGGTEADIALVGDSVRITSVFSFISPFGTFLNVALMLMLFFLSTLKLKNLIIINFAIYLLLIINALMTGSRSLVGIALLETLALIVLFNNFSIKKIIFKFSRGIIISILAYILLTRLNIGSKALENFISRVEINNDIEGRIYDTTDPFKFLNISGAFGFGIGSTYQGASSLTKGGAVVIPVYYEEEPERILLELGLVGTLISYFVKFYIFYYTYKIYRFQNDNFWKKLSAIPLIYMIVVLLGFFPIIFNWLEGITYWSFIGLAACIKHISNNEQFSQSISATSSNSV